MNHILKSRAEIDSCTEYIRKNGLIEHGISCKNFDIANIVPLLTDGNVLDMGSSGGSCILENAVRIGIKGRKVGIDLEYKEDSVSPEGIEYVKGDLMKTPFPSHSFQTLCCLSVIEHGVDLHELAKECSRLLVKGGKLYITCDYWPDKINTDGLTLYGLPWNILDPRAIFNLTGAMWYHRLEVSSEPDWEFKDAVINPSYCSPFPGISYTFFILEFVKN